MLNIGWSTKDITTTAPVYIPGQFFARVSSGVLDPLKLSALVIEGKNDLVIFVSGDAIHFEGGIIDIVRSKVKEMCSEIPVEKIILCATHSHTTPCNMEDTTKKLPPHDGIEIESTAKYREFLTTEAAKAVVEAYSGRKEGGIAYGYGFAVAGHSRRQRFLDDLSKREGADNNSSLFVNGHARMYGDSNDEMFSGYEAGADHFTNLLYTFDMEKRLTGAIINIPCPAQNSEEESFLSASYWNEVRNILNKKYGDIHILTQCAAAGDLAPQIQHYNKAQDRRFKLKYADMKIDSRVKCKTDFYRRIDIAERICDSFDEVLSWSKNDIQYEAIVKHTVKNIQLDAFPIRYEEYKFCKEQLELLEQKDFVKTGDIEADFKNNSIYLSSCNRFRSVIEKYEKQKAWKKVPMELHVVRIGDIAFATNAFELYMDYQHRIQARSPFVQTFVVQLCAQPVINGSKHCNSYLATQRAIDGKGYSAIMFSCDVSPKGGQELVEETLVELNKINMNQ